VNISVQHIDTGGDTILYTLPGPVKLYRDIPVVLTCPYTDPATAAPSAASNVCNPLVSNVNIRSSRSKDPAWNDTISWITYSIVPGASSAEVTVENDLTPTTLMTYLNFLQITGDIYRSTDRITFQQEDATSIAAYGLRPLTLDLEQITEMNSAVMMADRVLDQVKDPVLRVNMVKFLANFSDAFATAALTVEPNTRFAMKESQSGIDGNYHACRLKFQQSGPLLWVEILPAPAPAPQTYFLWDTADHGWDEGVWIY